MIPADFVLWPFYHKIYQRINIRIVLKALEIWTNGDPYERQSRGGPDLSKFNTYRRDHLMKIFPHDNAQLLRYFIHLLCLVEI